MTQRAPVGLWIDGRQVLTGCSLNIKLPYDGSVVGQVSLAGEAEVDAALAAAVRAAPGWRAATRSERASVLRRAHAGLVADAENLARTVSQESGKPIREGRIEVDRAGQTLLFAAEEAHRLAGEVVPLDAAP